MCFEWPGMKQRHSVWLRELTCTAPAHGDWPRWPAGGWWTTHCCSPGLLVQPKVCIFSPFLPVSSAAWHTLVLEASNASPIWPPPLQGKPRMFTWHGQANTFSTPWPRGLLLLHNLKESNMTLWAGKMAQQINSTCCQAWGLELNP